MARKAFLTDVQTLRARAREHIEEGAVTPAYGDEATTAVKILNDALATEIVCVLRYKLHYYVAKGIHSGPVADEFLEHANTEQEHADRIAQRIVQLGGTPELSPDGLMSRSQTEYVATDNLGRMIRENLVAERIVIDSYREIAAYFAPFDPTSRVMIEEILADEEEHADELADLLRGLPEGLQH